MGLQEEVEDWKAKYETCHEKLLTLEKLSLNAVTEYDEVVKQSEEREKQLKEAVRKLEQTEKEIQELNEWIEPACLQYNQLHEEYEIEKTCREEAVKYASNVVSDNKKLKRQSQDLLKHFTENFSAVDIPVDILEAEDETDAATAKYTETLNDKITELKAEVATLKANLKKTQEDLETEKSNNKWMNSKCENLKVRLQQTESSLSEHRDALREFSKVSNEAMKEYENLEEKYEQEAQQRIEAEQHVELFTQQNMKMKRQSNALIMQNASDDKLMKALHEIEELSDQLRDQKQKYDEEIQSLQGKAALFSKESQEQQEKERKQVQEEKDEIQTKLTEYEEKYTELETKYKDLEKKYDDATRPPPPPPPPPLPASVPLKGFLSRVKDKKGESIKKLQSSGVSLDSSYNKAVEEMMDQIKKGTISLRSTTRTRAPMRRGVDEEGNPKYQMLVKAQSLDDAKSKGSSEGKPADKSGAMQELNGLMNKLKRTHSEGEILAPEPEENSGFAEESELAKIFRRVKKAPSASVGGGGPPRTTKGLTSVQEEGNSQIENDVFEKSK